MISHIQFTFFFIKIFLAQTIYVIENMLFATCYVFVKSIFFFELFKALSFLFFNFSDWSYKIIYIYKFLLSGLMNIQLKYN